MSRFVIDRMEVDGHYDTRRITPWDYDSTCDEFASDKNAPMILPKWKCLGDIGRQDMLWILLHPITLTAFDKNDNWKQWRFSRGYIWDQASVPVFKNNLLAAILPAMPHDGAFSLHWYSFDETNDLFWQMCRYYGMNRVLAFFYRFAVSSIFGKARWENNERSFWHFKTAQYMDSRIQNHF